MGFPDTRRVALRLLKTCPLTRGVQVLDVTESTQDDAAVLARAGAPEGTVVLAARQMKGRGRLGRSWESPTGGLYASFVLRPGPDHDRWPALSVAAGTGLVRALRHAGIERAELKWPNDCLVSGRKLAGILIEAFPWQGFAIMGIGINVALAALPPGIAALATDLRSNAGHGADMDSMCADALAGALGACLDAGPVIDRTAALAVMDTGRMLRAGGVVGRVHGLKDDGTLVLATGNGDLVEIRSGEVTHDSRD